MSSTPAPASLSPGYGFGLRFAVLLDETAANTFFWIDPPSELVGMIGTQFNPFRAYEIEREFQTLVYDSLP